MAMRAAGHQVPHAEGGRRLPPTAATGIRRVRELVAVVLPQGRGVPQPCDCDRKRPLAAHSAQPEPPGADQQHLGVPRPALPLASSVRLSSWLRPIGPGWKG